MLHIIIYLLTIVFIFIFTNVRILAISKSTRHTKIDEHDFRILLYYQKENFQILNYDDNFYDVVNF